MRMHTAKAITVEISLKALSLVGVISIEDLLSISMCSISSTISGIALSIPMIFYYGDVLSIVSISVERVCFCKYLHTGLIGK
jgi:hypothetical protein